MRRHARPLVSALALALACLPHPTSAADLSFDEQSLTLPGAPAVLVAADVDGDGLRDLATVVVYTRWDSLSVEEWTEMDQVEGMVEVLTVVPVLLDRREVRVFRGRAGGGYEPESVAMELPLSVLTLEPGPPGAPVVALTDSGLSALRLGAEGLSFEPLLTEAPVLAGVGAFLADLRLAVDVTGDGVEDYLLPRPDGLAVHRGRSAGGAAALEAQAVTVIPLPGGGPDLDATTVDYPLPRLEDLDGDDRPEMIFWVPGLPAVDRFILPNLGDGRFGPPVALAPRERPVEPGAKREGQVPDDENTDDDEPETLDLVYLGPLTHTTGAAGAARTTAVYSELRFDEDAGLRKTMRQVREPAVRLHLHPLEPGFVPRDESEAPQNVTGYVPAFAGGDSGGSDDDGLDFTLPAGFQDLNGDGRVDLVSITNDITVMKAMAVLATKRLTLDLGFHPWCQDETGRFRRAPGPALESRLTLDLKDLELRRRSLFAGDFDGDRRADFLQLGKPRKIGIHRGRADCSYPEKADATLELRDPIRDLALVDARDLNGDGRSDLVVTHPQGSDDPGVTPTVRLDLYLSRSAEEAP